MPLELKGADFDAYAPERTRATAMTAPRSAVKRRLVAWAKGVAQRLAADGIDLEVSSTDEHPSARNGHRVDAQSAFLFRGSTARKEMQHALGRALLTDDERPELGHARIELRIDASAVSLVLWLGGDARVDLEHAAAVLTHDDEDVLAAWDALADPSLGEVSIAARAALSPRATRARHLPLREAARLAKDALESEVPLVVGVRLSRDEAIEEHALDAWGDVAIALAHLLQTLVWSPERAAVVAARLAERPSRRGKRARPKAPPPPPAPPAPEPTDPVKGAKPTIDRGAHVRALAGPFAGQAGVVQELDGKGGARVLFGLLAARVELRDLTVADKKRGRPLLSSSHRKPST